MVVNIRKEGAHKTHKKQSLIQGLLNNWWRRRPRLLINPAEEIYDGDSVLVEYGHNKNIAVKRIYWFNGSGIEIRSANGDGWKRTFTIEEQLESLLRIIGKVVWYGNKPKRG